MTGISMQGRTVGTIVLVVLASFAAPAHAQLELVVPDDLVAQEGYDSNIFPFATGGPPLTSMRYQQLFKANQFGPFDGPIRITEISFRPDAVYGTTESLQIADIQINLSTTTVADDALSTIFADNVGADDTVVFSGPLALTSARTGPAEGPLAFDYTISLQVPFLYDPTVGNLLLDVRNRSGAYAITAFDARYFEGDGVSRVFTNPFLGQDMTSAAGFADSLGLVAQFTASLAYTHLFIDIRPGNPKNTKNYIISASRGTVPVAILSTPTFNASRDVSVPSLTFGVTGNEASLNSCNSAPQDVNADGLVDLVCFFNTQATGFAPGDFTGVLKARDQNGQLLIGTDSVFIR